WLAGMPMTSGSWRSRNISEGEMQPQPKKMTGVVTLAQIAPGSKSEHQGVVLRTERGDEYVLRRAGGNAFRDEKIEALVGSTITGRGIVTGQSFIMQDWTVTKDKPPRPRAAGRRVRR